MRTRVLKVIIAALVFGAIGHSTSLDINAQLNDDLFRTTARARTRTRTRRGEQDLLVFNE